MGFVTFMGTVPLWRKKLTECTSKMKRLRDNMTNLHAKCRDQNAKKKNINLFWLFSILTSLEYTLNVPSAIFVVRG